MEDATADRRLAAVVELAQALATVQTPQEAARAGARRARVAMGGSFAAVSAWERETGRLRVLVNDGDLAPGEEPEPADESYSVSDFPEIAEFLHGSWARGGAPHAWVETAEGTGASPGGSSWGRAAAL
ncbi:MAG: diguanylate cyclase, partial [Streptomyces sp.]|nr:diguanylate cyclase [Streptomyces sp.]